MSLRSYDDAAAWAGSIEEAVKDNRMPPWHAGPGYGPFSNDRRLSDAERKTLAEIPDPCARERVAFLGGCDATHEQTRCELDRRPDVALTFRSGGTDLHYI